MPSPRALLRRMPFLAGLGAGASGALAVLGILAAEGAIDTDALYPPVSGIVRVWDRHGKADPDDWELLPQGRHRVADASDVYIQTDAVRIRGAADPGAPLTFAVQPLGREPGEAPLAVAPAASRTGPVEVDTRDQYEAELTLRTQGVSARLRVRATWHGYELRMEGPAAPQRLAVGTRAGPWVLQDEIVPRAAGSGPSGAREIRLAPVRAYTLSLAGRTSAVVVAATPQRLHVPASGAVTLTPQRPGLNRLFVAATQRPATLVEDPPARLRLRPPVAGRVLAAFLRGARLSGRTLRDEPTATVPVPAGTTLAGVQPMAGPDEPERLRGEAMSGFAAP